MHNSFMLNLKIMRIKMNYDAEAVKKAATDLKTWMNDITLDSDWMVNQAHGNMPLYCDILDLCNEYD